MIVGKYTPHLEFAIAHETEHPICGAFLDAAAIHVAFPIAETLSLVEEIAHDIETLMHQETTS